MNSSINKYLKWDRGKLEALMTPAAFEENLGVGRQEVGNPELDNQEPAKSGVVLNPIEERQSAQEKAPEEVPPPAIEASKGTMKPPASRPKKKSSRPLSPTRVEKAKKKAQSTEASSSSPSVEPEGTLLPPAEHEPAARELVES